jgi:thiamine pyrophosphokinase
MLKKVVIIADGSFPNHGIPLGFLKEADFIVCCDGSAESLLKYGVSPHAIVGDMDSLGDELKKRFADRLFQSNEQETNDLTKAVAWCRGQGYNDLVILGATGKREDHTVGNISLLADYARNVRVQMVTDTGTIIPFLESSEMESYPGQQVSVFSINPATIITSGGLKFPLVNRKLNNWWEATLNEAVGNSFRLDFTGGPVLVFRGF